MSGMTTERTLRPTAFRGLRGRVREAAGVMRGAWRGVLLAVIGGAIAVLIAEALGDSDDGKAVAALLGAATGTVTHHVAATLRWRDRTLSALAAVASALAVPGARRFVLKQTRGAAMATTTTPPALTTGIGASLLTTVIGAVAALAINGVGDPAGVSRVDTPEAAIAAYLEDKPGEYVGSCAGRSQRDFDAHPRRVCSAPGRRQNGGRLFAIMQPDWLDQFPVVLLREDHEKGWRVVGCVIHC
jgi:hypothetical protein